jgi:hypothetical protein
MSAIQSSTKFTDQQERELIRQEMNVFPLRTESAPSAGATPSESGNTRYSKALTVFKGALIAAAVVFVTITLALQAVARFS